MGEGAEGELGAGAAGELGAGAEGELPCVPSLSRKVPAKPQDIDARFGVRDDSRGLYLSLASSVPKPPWIAEPSRLTRIPPASKLDS